MRCSNLDQANRRIPKIVTSVLREDDELRIH